MPIYKEMQKMFQDHMKTLDMIGSKLKQMKDVSFRSMESPPPVINQFCDWLTPTLQDLLKSKIECFYICIFPFLNHKKSKKIVFRWKSLIKSK